MMRGLIEQYKEIEVKVGKYNPGLDKERLNKAFIYAEKMHENQTRMDGSPFVTHPLAVAELVADMEAETRRILQFLGLDWDPACLDFHENPRMVRTASHAQVRKPVYTTSVGRACKYREHLAPLVDGLRDGGYLDD